MASRTVTLLARGALLFLLSAVLVFGFWEHHNFYQIGFTNLLLLGGLVTFLVILGFRAALSGDLPRRRPRGELTFTLEEGDRLLRGGAQTAVRPAEADGLPTVGQIVWAKYDTGRTFGRLLVVDGARRFLGDLTDEDARRSGYASVDELRRAGAASWKWKAGDLVTVLTLRPVGRTA